MKFSSTIEFAALIPSVMILGQISYLDCLVFLFLLAPQLVLHVNIVELIACVVKALPFVRKSPKVEKLEKQV